MKATGGTIFKRHTTALDRPGGTLSLRPLQLLRALGVQGPKSELRLASREFGGHGLALNLLGTYLRDVAGGDIRRRGEVRLLEEDEEQGGQARRVTASYEKSFGESPEMGVLRLVGLFDRPAGGELVSVLRQPPTIDGLTDALAGLTERQWQHALSRLRRAQLLANADPRNPDGLDAHPLVREYFGDRLREDQPEAWREGHSRLYEHLRDTTKELPDTIEEMAPLFAAVAHGCHAAAIKRLWKACLFQRSGGAPSTSALGGSGRSAPTWRPCRPSSAHPGPGPSMDSGEQTRAWRSAKPASTSWRWDGCVRRPRPCRRAWKWTLSRRTGSMRPDPRSI